MLKMRRKRRYSINGAEQVLKQQYFLRAPAVVAYILGRIFTKLNAQGMTFSARIRDA